jgi:hypothetical protein
MTSRKSSSTENMPCKFAPFIYHHSVVIHFCATSCVRHLVSDRLLSLITKENLEEEETTQWPKEKVQKNKQRSTKHTYKTKDRVTRTPLKTGGELKAIVQCCINHVYSLIRQIKNSAIFTCPRIYIVIAK